MSKERKPSQETVEAICRNIGRRLGQIVDDSIGAPHVLGFAFLVFDYGDGGTMSYCSNAARDDMVKALRELLGHLDPPKAKGKR